MYQNLPISSPISYNNNKNQCVPLSEQLELEKYWQKKRMDVDAQAYMANLNKEFAIEVAQRKADIATKASETKTRRAIQREMATYIITEDTSGIIRCLMRVGDVEFQSNPILSVKHLRLVKFTDENKYKTFWVLKWDGCDKPVILSELTEKALRKCLMSEGVQINLTRRKRDDVLALVIAHLLNSVEEMIVPLSAGWCYDEKTGSWHYYNEDDLVLDSF